MLPAAMISEAEALCRGRGSAQCLSGLGGGRAVRAARRSSRRVCRLLGATRRGPPCSALLTLAASCLLAVQEGEEEDEDEAEAEARAAEPK